MSATNLHRGVGGAAPSHGLACMAPWWWMTGCSSNPDPMAAIMTMDLDLESTSPRVGSFDLEDAAGHVVEAWLDLRHGPQGARQSSGTLSLNGVATIRDTEGRTLLRRGFRTPLLAHEVGKDLFRFDASELPRHGRLQLSVELALDEAYREHYSSVRVTIGRRAGLRLLD
jgi:hypothetical protein